MNSSLTQPALTRLLVLNDQTHDLTRQLNGLRLPPEEEQWLLPGFTPSPVADLQDEIDKTARASLVTCWLGTAP